jgi:hypothetical protein
MTIFAESLKRLYNANRITKEDIAKQYEKGRISEKEYQEIIG